MKWSLTFGLLLKKAKQGKKNKPFHLFKQEHGCVLFVQHLYKYTVTNSCKNCSMIYSKQAVFQKSSSIV